MFAFTNSKNLVHHRFTKSDDAKLKELVREYGENNWKTIASKMEGRNKSQCRDRWFRYLSPHVNHGDWTEEEEKLLMNLVPLLYPRWRKISNYFNGRNDIQIKNRYKMIKNRISRENQNNSVDTKSDQCSPSEVQPNIPQPISVQDVHVNEYRNEHE